MSKILLINGSPNENGCTFTALSEVASELKKNDVESEIIWLGKKPIADCIACNHCRKTGRCMYNDIVNDVAARLDEFCGMVIGSPVYYGGSTGKIRSFLDRLFYSAPKEKIAGKLAASVVSCRRGGASETFAQLNMYYLMLNMIVVGSQYWNQVHGFTPEDVKKDEEGLQTMRTLAKNIAWLAKCIESGDKSGIPRPSYEPFTPTHFIR